MSGSSLSDRFARFVSSLPPSVVLLLVMLPFALSNPLLYKVGFVVLCIVGALFVCAAAVLLFAIYAAIGTGLSVLAYRYCRGGRTHYPRTPAGWESVGLSDCVPTYPLAISVPCAAFAPLSADPYTHTLPDVDFSLPSDPMDTVGAPRVLSDGYSIDPTWVADFERVVSGGESPAATCALPSVDPAPASPLSVVLPDIDLSLPVADPGDCDPVDTRYCPDCGEPTDRDCFGQERCPVCDPPCPGCSSSDNSPLSGCEGQRPENDPIPAPQMAQDKPARTPGQAECADGPVYLAIPIANPRPGSGTMKYRPYKGDGKSGIPAGGYLCRKVGRKYVPLDS